MSQSPSPKRLKTTGGKQQASLTSFFAPVSGGRKAPPSSATSLAARTAVEESNTKQKAVTPENDKSVPPAAASPATSSTTNTDAIIPTTVPWNASSWKVHDNNALLYRRQGPIRDKVAAIDLDGTLLVWRIAGWPSKLTDYELWSSCVLTKLRRLYDEENYQLVIISNQGGIRNAVQGKKATLIKNLHAWLAGLVDRPISIILSCDKKKGYHKPSVRLWEAAQTLLGNPEQPWRIADSFYVGDSVGDASDPQGGVDVGLARNVSAARGETLRFETPDDFFGPSHAQERQVTASVLAPVPQHVLDTRAALVSGHLTGPIIMLLCGAQGAGKSTVAQRIAAGSDNAWTVVAQDTIRKGKPGTREQVEAAVRHALAQQPSQCVMIDRMHLDVAQRAPWLELGKSLDIPVHALVLTPPVATLAQRVHERRNHPGKVEGATGARMATASAAKLVPPTYEEGFALVSGTSGSYVDRFVELYQCIGQANDPTHSLPTQFSLASKTTADESVVLPAVVLGTMGIGRKMAEEVVTQAVQAGLKGVDTAPTYKNEDKIGAVLPSDYFCIVKVPKRATTAAAVQHELHTSLQNVQREKVDLLLLHWPSLPLDTLVEVWQAMEGAVRDGQARALGLCNANRAVLASLLPKCRIRPVVLQIERHPLLPQWELLDFCAQQDIQVQAHTPLGQGAAELLQHPVMTQIAADYPTFSTAQVVLAWNLRQGVAVAPKASTPAHLRELAAFQLGVPGCVLTTAHMQTLHAVTDVKRFVAPFFMYGPTSFCWASQVPK
jgi:DNA 3'-phosphatase